jgi:type II secretory ATPase GspE/PulE/Tfp pilus assembly ATPase PilB-like protein
MLKITKELKAAIAKGATDVELRQIANEQGLVTLRSAAINKLLEGRTTIEEVFAVTLADK